MFFNEHCFQAFAGSFWKIHKYFYRMKFLCCVSLQVGCKCCVSGEYCSVFEGYSAHGTRFVHTSYVWQWDFSDRLGNHEINFVCNACLTASPSLFSLFFLIWTRCYEEVSPCKIETFIFLCPIYILKKKSKMLLPYFVLFSDLRANILWAIKSLINRAENSVFWYCKTFFSITGRFGVIGC